MMCFMLDLALIYVLLLWKCCISFWEQHSKVTPQGRHQHANPEVRVGLKLATDTIQLDQFYVF